MRQRSLLDYLIIVFVVIAFLVVIFLLYLFNKRYYFFSLPNLNPKVSSNILEITSSIHTLDGTVIRSDDNSLEVTLRPKNDGDSKKSYFVAISNSTILIGEGPIKPGDFVIIQTIEDLRISGNKVTATEINLNPEINSINITGRIVSISPDSIEIVRDNDAANTTFMIKFNSATEVFKDERKILDINQLKDGQIVNIQSLDGQAARSISVRDEP